MFLCVAKLVFKVDYKGRRIFWFLLATGLAGIYFMKVSNGNTKTLSEICSKLTVKSAERHWNRSGVFIISF